MSLPYVSLSSFKDWQDYFSNLNAQSSSIANTALFGLVSAATFAYLISNYYKSKQHPIDPLYDFDHQSIEIDPIEHIRVAPGMANKPLVEFRLPDVRTLFDILPKGKEYSNNGPCLGKREGPGKGPYTWIKYSDVIEQARAIGSAVVNCGIQSSNSTYIGIYSANRNEWIISEHACYSFSFPVVSLYDSYGKDSIKYILNHAEIKAIFIDNNQRLLNILEILDQLPYLSLIVHFDALDSIQQEKVDKFASKKKSVKVVSFSKFLDEGRNNLLKPMPPKPSDVATVCYTSGTTGVPKGAMITHGNIISNEAGVHERILRSHLKHVYGPVDEFDPPMVHMSYLPLAHMLEREITIGTLLAGGRLGFLSGDIKTLISDIQELKPTNVPMVPRVLNRVYHQVTSAVKSSKFKSYLLEKAVAAKEADRIRGVYNRNTIYDKLVFNKIRKSFGGNIVRIATGSAPISEEVMKFTRAVFGCPIPEGYGQTESTAVITFSHPLDPELGHCGGPVTCFMVKLVDVKFEKLKLNYVKRENENEIYCRMN